MRTESTAAYDSVNSGKRKGRAKIKNKLAETEKSGLQSNKPTGEVSESRKTYMPAVALKTTA